MSRRWILPLALVLAAGAQQPPARKENSPPPQQHQEQAPPEEDESLVPKEYSFNPLQAAKELKVGNYYFKKGSYRAAAQRYSEATKWDGTLAEAYLRLGEAKEKQHDKKAAAEAYAKYLELAPDAKDAAEVKKRLEKVRK
ncbi:MAG TPA: tetratricopeptide repeat protein [Bryobacteraceae bacterium]|jgi:tetratricopeptide (TPR) repeat protein|nr:tetratricopeptide repeat protein [Bryobacteraceae bacterium]